ncbi:LacI family DNA-binding transcriptional regulator [Paenibacillus sp. URB8-2]|uniref:LacI family DNA-binding transcriptional regulator n=1 Tax=Paenibacillus sp. URB8-2 TaxID=2741301 RepID=UPI0015C14213|nr:substrate-binding domain-containing protein [Paenibacillus sp. URB8-2]BCG57063.1 catabolite control protein A [Paenibacillus sp. URB8-2]
MSKIQEVAKLAGVSIATVSRALNDSELVSPDTRKVVVEAAKKLNYNPNTRVKATKPKEGELSIGIIIPDIATFYFGELYQGIGKVAHENKVNVLLNDLYYHDTEKSGILSSINFMQKKGVDGIILASRSLSDQYDEELQQVKVPIVLVLGDHEQSHLPSFRIDDIRASFDAASYLVSRGHRSIGVISAPLTNKVAGERRLAGFKRAVDIYNLPFTEQHIAYGDMRYEGGYMAMKELLSSRDQTGITAVFAATDEMAVGAMRCIYDEGLHVPGDISVIGYDNLSISNMTTPKLTTISQPFADIGMEGMKHLVQVLREPRKAFEQGSHFLPYKLIERESVLEVREKK